VRLVSHLVIALLRLLAKLPLPVVRALGAALGALLVVAVPSRVRVVEKNLSLCFPEHSMTTRRRHCHEIFKKFAQTWLDRAWLWHAPPRVLKKRLRLTGAVHELGGNAPTVLFAPHFMGLDAGWTALTLLSGRAYTTIYTEQANRVMDRWILRGRQQHGSARLFTHVDGVRPLAQSLKKGDPLYLLPDMDFGDRDCVFVPFFGIQAATVPSLSRFAKLGGERGTPAKVVPVVSRMTAQGYEVEILPAWADFPTDDPGQDTARMNRELEAMVRSQIAEYYWVHKRFKTRPEGQTDFYS
jgi:Kdo2-lipid IVA lauroyltransferase/acyltransferase